MGGFFGLERYYVCWMLGSAPVCNSALWLYPWAAISEINTMLLFFTFLACLEANTHLGEHGIKAKDRETGTLTIWQALCWPNRVGC
ncbi:hypothetical protein P154DRAFT_152630 [Amniculicola lignicola CBS 123094]|uniref:Uncharacterized protein n=1 Tax=Amniculicola lignicola CBS 123094 TaxID=1392246 RepID=A0A6A5VV96_9PLEO|nr:hypothetical protein P154DRAFT_152630 [Amniculicola lignicola CBS 123094]